MAKMNWLDWIAIILLIIGGINWGLVGFGFNLVTAIVGSNMIAKVIYWFVGIAAIYSIVSFVKLAAKK